MKKILIALSMAALICAGASGHAAAKQLWDRSNLDLSGVVSDPVLGKTLVAWDRDAESFRISTDFATTWSAPKGSPRPSLWRITATEFSGKLYIAASTAKKSNGVEKVWSTPLTPDGKSFSFTDVWTGPPASSSYPTDMDKGGGYLYLGTYGDPASPGIFRTADGTSWRKVASLDSCRHVHAVAVDPFHPHVVCNSWRRMR